MNYPIAISPPSDTGAIALNDRSFIGDTVASWPIAVPVIGVSYLVGRSYKSPGIGTLVGVGILYALWSAGLQKLKDDANKVA